MGEKGPSKKQRIETLEKEVSELKLIVHELRERKAVEPSTVEDVLQKEFVEVIEFEGAKYRKVDREARQGDVVVLKSHAYASFKPNNPYKVFEHVTIQSEKDTQHKGNFYNVYESGLRTPETVDVYELITEPSTTTTVEDKQDVQRQTVPCAAAKTPNQLRAEIIEKAKVFFDANGGSEFTFSPVANERSIFCWKVVSNGYGFDTLHGLSSCHPNDVFNEHIGKAIALGRALKLDVSEFELAVQPTVAVGQEVYYKSPFMANFEITTTINGFHENGEPTNTYNGGTMTLEGITIINDTNAIYGGVE